MKITLKSTMKLNQLSNMLKQNDLNITSTQDGFVVSLKNVQEIDILLAYLSRFIFTKTCHKFEQDMSLTSEASIALRNNFGILLLIDNRLINFLRNDNQILDIDNFIKYNLYDIDNKYHNLLMKLSIDKIKHEIVELFDKETKNKTKIIKINMKFVCYIDDKRKFILVTDMKKNNILEIHDDNFLDFMRFIKKYKVSTIIVNGSYTNKVINDIMKLLVLNGVTNVKWEFTNKEV